jgi:hypothetical protein
VGLAVDSALRATAGQGVVWGKPGEADAAADELPRSRVRRMADKATDVTAFCCVEVTEADAAADEPPIPRRENVANEAADSNRHGT